MKDYLIVGLNHKTAPIGVREKLSFPSADLKDPLERLTSLDHVEEGLILSTCNRVEIYTATSNRLAAVDSVKNFLSAGRELPPQEIYPHLYCHQSLPAVSHLFRVASSLDSMVVGETQITGQVKKAYSHALECRSTGSYLNRLLNRALFVAKKVRTETGISRHPVSVGQAAVCMTEKIFEDLSRKKVCLVGAGKVGTLVLDRLRSRGVGELLLLNRNFSKAEELVHQSGERAYSLDRLEAILKDVDVVLTSIESALPLVTRAMMARVMKKRKNRPVFVIDLGVPRNVSPAVGSLGNVYLYNVDDLQQVVEAGLAARRAEACRAEQIVGYEARSFYEKIKALFTPLTPLKMTA
jgi:glutamyl-tRNA reductase